MPRYETTVSGKDVEDAKQNAIKHSPWPGKAHSPKFVRMSPGGNYVIEYHVDHPTDPSGAEDRDAMIRRGLFG